MTPQRRDAGAVLVVVVLMTLAMLGLAHGLLVSAEGAYGVSRTHARLMELEARTAGVLERALTRGGGAWMDTVPVGASRAFVESTGGRASVAVRWRRLGAEPWLVEAKASPAVGPPVGRRRLAWVLDPAARVAALPGAVSIGPGAPVAVYGSITPDVVPGLGVVAAPALGLLDLRRLLEVADPVGPAGTPAPVESGGVCVGDDPWSWGDPVRPHRPCGGHFVLKGSSSSLVVDGGVGQGLLAVDGDLTLTGATVFHGVIVASGQVELGAGATVEGRVVAFGGIEVETGSVVVGAPRRAERALAEVGARLRPIVPLHDAERLGPG